MNETKRPYQYIECSRISYTMEFLIHVLVVVWFVAVVIHFYFRWA